MSTVLNRTATVIVPTAATFEEAERTVAQYLPANYVVDGSYDTSDGWAVMIEGRDRDGWTLDGYVLPRLESGLMFGEEVL